VSTTLRLGIGSIFVGALVLAIKTLAWWLTGSIALLSDALESTVNVATAIAALIAIRVAARPAECDCARRADVQPGRQVKVDG